MSHGFREKICVIRVVCGLSYSALEVHNMRFALSILLLSFVLLAVSTLAQTPVPSFTVDQILGFPSPENLIAAPAGSAIAWTFNERGVRNVYVADAPRFEARRITS